MGERRSVSTGSPYEPIVGISRAVRIGNVVAVAGTAPLGTDGKTVGVWAYGDRLGWWDVATGKPTKTKPGIGTPTHHNHKPQ